MTHQLATYEIKEFVNNNGEKVYSLWAHFSNDTVTHCGHFQTEWKAKLEQERLEEFATKLLQAAKDSF